MDTEFYAQSQTVPSSLSTATELSQEFSPPKLKHHDSMNIHYSCTSSQNSSKIFAKNDGQEPSSLAKKPIFKIIREEKTSQSSTMPLNKDFGNYNRKEKSLGELSKRLLIMFGRIDQCVISLDTVTQQLGVERRRIYDIINILESLGVVYRKGKNSYQWKGLKSIHETIKKLQRENNGKYDDKSFHDHDDDESDDEAHQSKSTVKREKSLGLLSTGFIKLFLSWKGTISLEQAGRKLSSENVEENKIKTKIRRLYDIANVFSSLGLIKKTCLESKKPAYEWVGLPGLDAFIKRLNTSSDEREIFQESSSKNKEKPSVVIPEVKPLEKQHSFNIQSDNSAFKSRETPLVNPDVLENLLGLLVNLYKGQQAPMNKMRDEDSLASLLLKRNYFDASKLMKHASSPARFDRPNMGFTTPNIRKSVSIIQRVDASSEVSTEGKKSCETTGFQDHEHDFSSIKRIASQDLSGFESRTAKKMRSFKEFRSNESSAIKSLNFQDKENYSIGANSNIN